MSSAMLCYTARCIVSEQGGGLQVVAAKNPFRAVTPGQVSTVTLHLVLSVVCVVRSVL